MMRCAAGDGPARRAASGAACEEVDARCNKLHGRDSWTTAMMRCAVRVTTSLAASISGRRATSSCASYSDTLKPAPDKM